MILPVSLKSDSIDDYKKPNKVNIGNENTFEELSHAFITIETVNHEESVTRFISSKQWYGSCEQRFGTTTLLSEDIIIDEGKFNVSNKNKSQTKNFMGNVSWTIQIVFYVD